jgi:hypothetical protein
MWKRGPNWEKITMNCDDPGSMYCPICCCCDEAAAFRCHRCGEFYCRKCFGPGHAMAGDPCRDCSRTLAPRDLESASPNVIIYGENRAVSAEVEKTDKGRV